MVRPTGKSNMEARLVQEMDDTVLSCRRLYKLMAHLVLLSSPSLFLRLVTMSSCRASSPSDEPNYFSTVNFISLRFEHHLFSSSEG